MGTLCVSKYGKGRKISLTCLRYSANHNALDSWPIRAHRAFQNDELLKIDVFHKGGAERSNNTVQYVENNVCFFTLNRVNTLHYTRGLQPSTSKEPFWPLSHRIKFMWSHKIFDAQIKITLHIVKVLYSVMLQGMQGSSNHFRSERDRNVKCSNNNNNNYNIYVCIIDKK